MKFNRKNYNTVLIGCGYWGTNIAKVLWKLKKKRFLIYDKKIKNAITLSKRFKNNIQIEKNLNKIIEDKKIKNVFLATPPIENFNLIKRLIKHNKNIFIEKPGLKNLKEINEINSIKEKKIIMFGYIYVFNNNIKFIKKFINDKKNGKILYIKFQRQNLGPIRNDVNASYDLSSHDLSILYFLFNKIPNKIKNFSHSILKKNISDISNLSFKFMNFFVDINNSWLNPDKVRRLTIVTEKKMLLFDEIKNGNKIKIYNKYATYPKISDFKDKFFNKKAKIYEGKNYSPKIKQNDILSDEIKYFFDCVKNKKKPITNINFAIKILQCLKNI